MTTSSIETQRVAGEITLVLKNGPDAARQSLLRVIEKLCGGAERRRLEAWVAEGMPGA